MSMRMFYQIHRWVSLICALFFLMLALTGLPMLFRDQLRAWNTVNLPPAGAPMPQAEIWKALPDGYAAIEANFPNKDVLAVTPNAADGTLYFSVQTRGTKTTERTHMRMGGEQIMYDVRTGGVFNRKDRIYRFQAVEDMLHWAHLLHTQLGTAGMAGKHFLALMCILAVLSIVTGLFLYAPMMKGLAFGTIRGNTRRLVWSDRHKFVSVFALVWAVVLCLSGVMIAAYSAGVKSYHRDAHMAAMTALSDLPAAETALSPADAFRTVSEAFPDKLIISMQIPQGTNKNYAFHVADPPIKPTNFVLDEMVFLPKSGSAAPLLVPAPDWMYATPIFLNLHIHNHDWIVLKIAWAALLLLTIAMIVTGCVLLWTRRHNATYRNVPAVVRRIDVSIWRAPAAIAVLSVIGLFAPIAGGMGNAVGLAALGLPIAYFCYLSARG
ncbi:hypothetical protein HMPREF9161_00755 [Selenomonas sp. F0473]|nr:hypothetical protein HMPREF9161_00755 [Selenomonas sp. F0473]